jgi:hypothetical protein
MRLRRSSEGQLDGRRRILMSWKFSTAAPTAIFLAGLMVAGCMIAQAQSTVPAAPPNPPGAGENVLYLRAGPGPLGAGDAMDFVGFEAGLGGNTVTGEPFTATINVQRTQTLADGNVISRTTTGTIARDSQGRVRRDMTLAAIGAFATTSPSAPHVIFINDVVSGEQYILEPNRKIAHEVRLMRQGSHMRAKRAAGQSPDNRQVWARSGQGVGDVTTTSLGTQTVNGVEAQGTRYTQTIPAGTIGNEKAIVITTDCWYAPELQMYVLTKTTDPMRGDSVRQLTNIQTGEPSASLFQVPPDYTLKKGGIVRIRRRARLGGSQGMPPPPPEDGPELAPSPDN